MKKPLYTQLFIFLILVGASAAFGQDRGLLTVARSVAGTDVKIGKQYAVLIAIDRYDEWMPLRNPVKDAKAVKDVLSRRYYIDEFIELYDADATSAGIRQLFGRLIDTVGPTDSVFVYYAGHGHTDRFQTGFWIPVDGSKNIDSQDRWIPNQQIRNFISQMKARSVALFTDSCFSGDLLNVQRGAAPTIDSEYFRNALRYTARQVLTSGASESVPDESEFARQFKNLLENNTEAYLDPLAMYDRIRRGVSKTLPLFGTLPGHETGGSFVLFLKNDTVPTPAPSSKPTTAIQRTGQAKIQVQPADVMVSVDGAAAVVPASELYLEPGTHKLAFSAPGYHGKTETVRIEAGKATSLTIQLVEFDRATLEIPILPFGVILAVNGMERITGGTSFVLEDIPAGYPVPLTVNVPYALELDPAYSRTEITLSEGAYETLELPVGYFSVPWLPEGAELCLAPSSEKYEGIYSDPVPLTLDSAFYLSPALAAGTYTVELLGPYKYSEKLTIETGTTRELPGYRSALISAIGAERDAVSEKLKARSTNTTLGWVSFGTGVAGSAAATAIYILGARALDQYKAAVSTADAQFARARTELYGALFPAVLSVGSLGLGLSPILWFGGPDPKVLERSIEAMDESLRKLRGE